MWWNQKIGGVELFFELKKLGKALPSFLSVDVFVGFFQKHVTQSKTIAIILEFSKSHPWCFESFFDMKKLYLEVFHNNDFNGSFNEWNQFCEWLLQSIILLTCIIWKFKTSNYLIIAYLIVWKWFVALTNVLVFSREIKCKRKYEGS